jgi:hypothetical protein
MALSTPPSLARPAAFCLVAAPLLLAVADVLQVMDPGTIPWTVILWAAFVVFVPAIFTVAALLRERAPRWALLGGAAATTGAVAGAGIAVLSRVRALLASPAVDPAVGLPAREAIEGSSLIALTTLVPGILFPLGTMLLAAGLGWTRRVPRGAAALLGLGGLLFPVGHAVGVPWALVGGDLVLLAAYGWIAAEVLGPAAAPGEPAAAARTPVRAAG